MSKLSHYKETLRAMLKGDSARAKELSEQLGDVPWVESGALATAVCAILAEDHFQADDSPEAIKRSTDETLRQYVRADPALKPLLLEAVTRAALGESELLQGVDVDDLTIHQMALMNKLVDEADLSEQQIDELLDEAEEMLNEV